MMRLFHGTPGPRLVSTALVALAGTFTASAQFSGATPIGREVAILRHLQDGEEYQVSLPQLVKHGRDLFTAGWTEQEGGGRPFSKGTGAPLADPTQPLVFPRNFNRLSAPEANSCAGCHAQPFGVAGGGSDIVANVFVLAQWFDFLTFGRFDLLPTKGSVDEIGRPVMERTVANSRATLGMWGAGYIEMLARQITRDLQAIRDALAPGESRPLSSKGISYGTILRRSPRFPPGLSVVEQRRTGFRHRVPENSPSVAPGHETPGLRRELQSEAMAAASRMT